MTEGMVKYSESFVQAAERLAELAEERELLDARLEGIRAEEWKAGRAAYREYDGPYPKQALLHRNGVTYMISITGGDDCFRAEPVTAGPVIGLNG